MNRHRSLTFFASSSVAALFDATRRSDASRAATPSGPAGSGVTGSADPVAASGSSTVTGTSSYASASLLIAFSPPSSPAGPSSSRGWRSSGKTSSRVSGRHRPCDRAPPTPASAARTSAQKNARSSSLRAAAFASTASSTCGGRGRLPERFMWPPRPRPPPPLPRPFLSPPLPPLPPLPPRPPRPPRPRDMRSAATGAKASSGRAADIVARTPRASRLCRDDLAASIHGNRRTTGRRLTIGKGSLVRVATRGAARTS